MGEEALVCREDHRGNCSGPVTYQMVESATSVSGYRSYPYCENHWKERCKFDEEQRTKYPVNAPSDFDPTYAGERWEDGY